jgi:hypothetical protein
LIIYLLLAVVAVALARMLPVTVAVAEQADTYTVRHKL